MLPFNNSITAVQNFPEPSTIHQMKRFLEMLNFYRPFLLHVALVQVPLRKCIIGSKKHEQKKIK